MRNKKLSKVQLEVDDLVLVRSSGLSSTLDKVTKKFFQLYKGPYKIKKIIQLNAYQLCDTKHNEKIRGIFNKMLLKKYYSNKVENMSTIK